MERKPKLLLAAAAAAAMLLTACGVVPIGRVLHDPSRYQNRSVTVEGSVTSAYGALGTGAYQVEDATGKIYVLSGGRGMPGKGARVRVSGTVTSGLQVMGKSYGTTIREQSHKVKY